VKRVAFFVVLSASLIAGYYSMPYQKLPKDVVVDSLVVSKSEHNLIAYSKGIVIKKYTVSLGKGGNGKKQYEGDNKTPEGNYYINSKNPSSGFHKNLGISYPSPKDIAVANSFGRAPGGDIKIHGLKNGQGFIGRFQRWRDWTNGCIGLTDDEIDDLYDHTPVGTTIKIIK